MRLALLTVIVVVNIVAMVVADIRPLGMDEIDRRAYSHLALILLVFWLWVFVRNWA